MPSKRHTEPETRISVQNDDNYYIQFHGNCGNHAVQCMHHSSLSSRIIHQCIVRDHNPNAGTAATRPAAIILPMDPVARGAAPVRIVAVALALAIAMDRPEVLEPDATGTGTPPTAEPVGAVVTARELFPAAAVTGATLVDTMVITVGSVVEMVRTPVAA